MDEMPRRRRAAGGQNKAELLIEAARLVVRLSPQIEAELRQRPAPEIRGLEMSLDEAYARCFREKVEALLSLHYPSRVTFYALMTNQRTLGIFQDRRLPFLDEHLSWVFWQTSRHENTRSQHRSHFEHAEQGFWERRKPAASEELDPLKIRLNYLATQYQVNLKEDALTIRQRIRALAKQYHPDRAPDKTSEMQEINELNELLSEYGYLEEKRTPAAFIEKTQEELIAIAENLRLNEDRLSGEVMKLIANDEPKLDRESQSEYTARLFVQVVVAELARQGVSLRAMLSNRACVSILRESEDIRYYFDALRASLGSEAASSSQQASHSSASRRGL